MSNQAYRPFEPSQVQLLPSPFLSRYDLIRNYLLSLTDENLLRGHYQEAGLWSHHEDKPEGIHWGWDSPTSQLRGQFLGHWMSAAARMVATTGDQMLKARIDFQVAELAKCQVDNGGEWVGPIPEKYLHWTTTGKYVWAPHYVIHKGLMGLLDAYKYAKNPQALDVLNRFAKWFSKWTEGFSREQMDNILDVETGGMLESWADLYGITGDEEHLALVYKYDRPRLFDRLIKGEDALTNQHANTTIPEVEGAARAWEVTGDPRWRDIAEAYWDSAVNKRGTFCTGGQTCGEVWTPPGLMAMRLSDKNQEHCTVYNMMRLADYMFRWNGDIACADYYERNLYNGILAQQNPDTGMITYFLPLRGGSKKTWGSLTDDFWCCHGSLVQAHTLHNSAIYYQDDAGIAVCQNIPSELTFERGGAEIKVRQTEDRQTGSTLRPMSNAISMKVTASQSTDFKMKLRLPWWIAGEAVIKVNGEPIAIESKPSSWVELDRKWQEDTIHITLPKKLETCPLPDDPTTVAFMEGPVVLAGLCDADRVLMGTASEPNKMLQPDAERHWNTWHTAYRTIDTDPGIRFIPLHEVRDEAYSVYFKLKD